MWRVFFFSIDVFFYFFFKTDPVFVPTFSNTPLVGGWKQYSCLFPVLQGLWGTLLFTRAVCTTSRAAHLLHHRGRSRSTATTGQWGARSDKFGFWNPYYIVTRINSGYSLNICSVTRVCNPFPTEWWGRQRRQRLVMCFHLRSSTSVRNTGRGFSRPPVRTRGGWGTAHGDTKHIYTHSSRSYI